MKRRVQHLLSACLCVAFINPASAEVKRAKFTAPPAYLIVETLDDDLVHFEFSSIGTGADTATPLYTSPMIDKTDYAGPVSYSRQGNTIETGEIRVGVDTTTLCISMFDKARNKDLTTICPADLGNDWKGLNIAKGGISAVYGLGQQFKALGSTDGDWLQHLVREEQPMGQAQAHGNGFMPFGPAGMVGNVQFPVMYALGDGNLNYALLIDNVYKQRWDFSADPWQARMWGDQIRFYIMTGPDLPDLRKDYMELTGRPPVPPRKAFGLWVSEFGYKDWRQVDRLRAGLRDDSFPVDGFVLDLQWFGGVTAGSPDSKMGKLDWDQDQNDGNGFYFPEPERNIAALGNDHVGLVTIEESYVARNTDTFSPMKDQRLLAYGRTDGRCDPAHQDPVVLSDWFGAAGMIDWSNQAAGQWVHENRRFPNITSKGILGHWTDLGEPEKYDANACYKGVETTASGIKNQHGDIHNLYAFLWNRSIYDGYFQYRDKVARRPFILSRSGAPGSQRYGVAMWSGDIGSSLTLLATHLNSQMHMSFSGVDYYGADIGGFRREGIPYNGNHSGNLQYQNELYTQWLANGAWFDVPVRPHTDNSFQTNMRYETAPNLVGDARSNLANLRQRYELIPYYYSLAYRAYLYGEPVMPPPVFYYQNDPKVRQMGHEKIIGKDLLVAVSASHGEYVRDIYLPAGKWANYHTGEWFTSSGQWVNGFPTYLDSVFRLPAFARAGAIIPMMRVDELTKDTYGYRRDNTVRDELVVRVYADTAATSFTLYEDDGATQRYGTDRKPLYSTRTTVLSQKKTGNKVSVVIDRSAGTYPGAVPKRNNVVRLIVEDARAGKVTLNGSTLTAHASAASFEQASSGWFNAGRNEIMIKSGIRNVDVKKSFIITLAPLAPSASVNFVCDNGWTALGEDVYITGSDPRLGGWDPAKGIKLNPSVFFEYIYNPPPNHNGPGPSTPKWTGLVQNLPVASAIEWKCVKKLSMGQWQWQDGSNNVVNTPASGFGGTSTGIF